MLRSPCLASNRNLQPGITERSRHYSKLWQDTRSRCTQLPRTVQDYRGRSTVRAQTSPLPQSNSTSVSRRDAITAALWSPALAFISLLAPSHSGALEYSSTLEEEIRAAVQATMSKAQAPGVLRMAFHDAGTFDLATGTGGPNGSILLELDRPESAGLKRSVKVLKKTAAYLEKKGYAVSWADLIAVAGAEAAEICGGPHIPVGTGRPDSRSPDPEGRMPDEADGPDALKANFRKKGFGVQEMVALLGAHSLGGKGFGDPTTFDNAYYTILLQKPWMQQGNKMTEMIGLPSDRIIVEDPECLEWIKLYAADQDKFFVDFRNAYVRMVTLVASNP